MSVMPLKLKKFRKKSLENTEKGDTGGYRRTAIGSRVSVGRPGEIGVG